MNAICQKILKNIYAFSLLLVCILVIMNSVGCGTIKGFGEDLSSASNFLEHKLNFGWKDEGRIGNER